MCEADQADAILSGTPGGAEGIAGCGSHSTGPRDSVVVLASHLIDEGHFRSEHYRVQPLLCIGPSDYSWAWQHWWDTPHTLVNVEHDHPATDEQVAELLDCPHDFCTWAYTLYAPSIGGRPHYAQRHGGTNYGEWICDGEEWCDFTGIGFCKITREARVRPLAESSWQVVDCAISEATGVRVHVHWPAVEHFHRE